MGKNKLSKKAVNTMIGVGAVAFVSSAALASGSAKDNIDISENFTFDCNATYDATSNSIRCTEQEINGKYSAHDGIKLMNGETDLSSADGNFSKKISVEIPASEYEVDTYYISDLEKKYETAKETFALYDEANGETKQSKEITITWNFDLDDARLIEKKSNEWKEKKRAEEKAAREAEEAAAAAEAEAKAAAAATQQQSSTPAASNNSSTSGSSSNYSPNSGVDYTVTGYCNDGTLVTGNPSAAGKASKCYGHGGWRDY